MLRFCGRYSSNLMHTIDRPESSMCQFLTFRQHRLNFKHSYPTHLMLALPRRCNMRVQNLRQCTLTRQCRGSLHPIFRLVSSPSHREISAAARDIRERAALPSSFFSSSSFSILPLRPSSNHRDFRLCIESAAA